jgi:hypothetical protein
MASNLPLPADQRTAANIHTRVDLGIERAMGEASFAFPGLDPVELEREVAMAAWRWAERHGLGFERAQDAPDEVFEVEGASDAEESETLAQGTGVDLAAGRLVPYPSDNGKGNGTSGGEP